jgi:glucosamine--fructose-6-phosphate aminotransferase (isomerizing)
MDALECGRYAAARFGPDVLVLGISNSGKTSRVLESIALAARAGATTLALTGAAGSPLERVAGVGVVRPIVGAGGREGPTVRLERHFGEYIGTLAALFHLALWLGAARGMTSAHDTREQTEAIQVVAAVAQRLLADGPPQVARALEHLGNTDRVFYLGAGPAYGTALFGAAKLMEEVPMCGVPQHLEEWAHLEYFLTMVEGERTRIVVIAPPGDSTDRAVEILQAVREDHGIAVAVTHAHEDGVRRAASATIVVDGDVWEGYAPMPYAVPVQLLGIALALHRGQPVVPLSRRDAGRLIRDSAMRGLPHP